MNNLGERKVQANLLNSAARRLILAGLLAAHGALAQPAGQPPVQPARAERLQTGTTTADENTPRPMLAWDRVGAAEQSIA